MQLVDPPKPATLAEYTATLDRVIGILRGNPGLLAVWQIGSIGTPGISDLDLVALFSDDAHFPGDIRTGLEPRDRYFILHSAFGIGLKDWNNALQYSFFHNYKLLWGEAPAHPARTLSGADQAILKRQIALEYLLRILASLTAEITYGIVRLRNLFLHAKAMLYDCEYLGITGGDFPQAVSALVDLRSRWFDRTPSTAELRSCISALHQSMAAELDRQLRQTPICFPARPHYRISRNMAFVPDTKFEIRHRGVRLPSALAVLGRSYFNFQHRLNRFEFSVPIRTHDFPEVITRTFEVRDALEQTRKRQFPSFLTLTSGYNFL